jgi:hypothetical protein
LFTFNPSYHLIMKKIGIIGPNTPVCSEELYRFGVELGKEIAAPDMVSICGGRASELAGRDLDDRAGGLLIPVSTIEEIKGSLQGAYRNVL